MQKFATSKYFNFRYRRSRLWGRYDYSDRDLRGQTLILTGANAGLGRDAARILAEKGARVILACRNLETGGQAVEEIK